MPPTTLGSSSLRRCLPESFSSSQRPLRSVGGHRRFERGHVWAQPTPAIIPGPRLWMSGSREYNQYENVAFLHHDPEGQPRKRGGDGR